MPCAIEETVAVGLAWRSILFESVEWLTLIGPHLLAVVADDDCHVGARLGTVSCHQRRPVLRAGAVTHRLAAGILVERIKRHTLCIDKRFALWCISRLQHFADAADEARIKAKAATAANVLDIAALLLLLLFDDAGASLRQTPAPRNFPRRARNFAKPAPQVIE